MTHLNQTDENPFSGVEFAPQSDGYAHGMSDAERLLRQADDLEQTAELLVSHRAGARLLRSQAVALRKMARGSR